MPVVGSSRKRMAGAVDDPGGHGQLAFHALGIGGELPVPGLGQVKGVQQFQGPGAALAFGQAVERGAEAQVLVPREFRVEVALVRDHAQELLGRAGALGAVQAVDADGPRAGPGQAGEHVDGRGLARAVGAQESEQFAPAHVKGHVPHGGHVAEVLDQVAGDNGRSVRGRGGVPGGRGRLGGRRGFEMPGCLDAWGTVQPKGVGFQCRGRKSWPTPRPFHNNGSRCPAWRPCPPAPRARCA